MIHLPTVLDIPALETRAVTSPLKRTRPALGIIVAILTASVVASIVWPKRAQGKKLPDSIRTSKQHKHNNTDKTLHNSHLIASTLAIALSCVSCTSVSSRSGTMTKESQAATTPAQALERLKSGNGRFVNGSSIRRNLKQQVADTAAGQYPFATVVSCLDSRTSTELVFDQGIGDVFNARVAGNVVNPDIIGSLEFASKVAGSKLIAVIGHTSCGAVKGACDHVELGNLTGLLERIAPAVTSTKTPAGEKRTSKNYDFVDRVAENNVRLAMSNIRKQSPILREMEAKGEIRIVGGMQDLHTGKVTFID